MHQNRRQALSFNQLFKREKRTTRTPKTWGRRRSDRLVPGPWLDYGNADQ